MKPSARVTRSLLLVTLASACTRPAPTGAIVLVDDAGDTVRLAAPARRVVSLIPATTELLFAIGAGNAVAGRTHWDDYPAPAQAVPDVGDGLEPNLEAVLARRPDLVLLYRGSGTAAAADRLRGLGIPTLLLRTDRLEDVPRVARILGAATGHVASADSLDAAYRRALDSASVPPSAGAPARPSARPSVLLLAWEDPPLTIGAGSFLDELVERAGGRNVFHDLAAASGPVSLEAIAARDPDLILSVGDGTPTIAGRPEWRAVRAVREGRFVHVSGSEFARPGPRSPLAVSELRAALARAEGAR
ncbi:MAG TPA: helical backbone metal receptor [Gemmatimonadales bacterium]|nr:helical backbone metal receptor [Gemmatimonadales bacterium]